MKREAAIEPAELDVRNGSVLDDLEPTSRTVLAAHEADLQGAIASVRWARRGVLQQLIRVER
jgi:hypothetical protein